MVSAICKAKNKETCPYHGAVIRMNRLEKAMAEYLKENGTLPGELLDKYIDERNTVLTREREGWKEEDYQEKIVDSAWYRKTTAASDALLEKEDGTKVVHPAQILDTVMKRKRITDKDLVERTGLSKEEVHNLMVGRQPITPRIAYHINQLEPGNTMGSESYWLNRQREYSELLEKEGRYNKCYPDHTHYIPGNHSEEVMSGQVVDTMMVFDPDMPDHEGTVFYRATNEVSANEPYNIRIQANRTLSQDDVVKMASILGYSYRSTVAGEPLGMPYQDSPYSFVVPADTTKSRRDDLGMAIESLETKYPEMLIEGTPQRKTMDNTRAIDGFEDDSLEVEFYYDSAYFS